MVGLLHKSWSRVVKGKEEEWRRGEDEGRWQPEAVYKGRERLMSIWDKNQMLQASPPWSQTSHPFPFLSPCVFLFFSFFFFCIFISPLAAEWGRIMNTCCTEFCWMILLFLFNFIHFCLHLYLFIDWSLLRLLSVPLTLHPNIAGKPSVKTH